LHGLPAPDVALPDDFRDKDVAAADQTVISGTGKTLDIVRESVANMRLLQVSNRHPIHGRSSIRRFYHHYAQSHGADQLAAAYHCLHSTRLCLIRRYRKWFCKIMNIGFDADFMARPRSRTIRFLYINPLFHVIH